MPSSAHRRQIWVVRFSAGDSAEAYWELFASSYGPTKTLAENLGERRGELQQAWVDRFNAKYAVDGGKIVHTREYLLVLGTRK